MKYHVFFSQRGFKQIVYLTRYISFTQLCFIFRRAAHGGWSCEFDENYPNALERSATNICFLLSLAVFQKWTQTKKKIKQNLHQDCPVCCLCFFWFSVAAFKTMDINQKKQKKQKKQNLHQDCLVCCLCCLWFFLLFLFFFVFFCFFCFFLFFFVFFGFLFFFVFLFCFFLFFLFFLVYVHCFEGSDRKPKEAEVLK